MTISSAVCNGVNNMDEVTNLTGQQFWVSEVTAGKQGRCHTLNYTRKIQSLDLQKESILIILNTDLQYWISLHQLSFFLLNFNPMTLPLYDSSLQFDEDASPYLQFLIIEAVRHEKISREGAGCNPALDYHFSSCVKQSISEEIGCKLPWDEQTTGGKVILTMLSLQVSAPAGKWISTLSLRIPTTRWPRVTGRLSRASRHTGCPPLLSR